MAQMKKDAIILSVSNKARRRFLGEDGVWSMYLCGTPRQVWDWAMYLGHLGD